MAADPPVYRLAHQHDPGGAVRSDQPPDHLPGPGPPLRPTPGGGQHRADLCAQHATRQTPVLDEAVKATRGDEGRRCFLKRCF